MAALRLPSAGQRFFRTLAFSLLQAAIFGSAVGLLVYFRPTATEWVATRDEPRRFGAGLTRWLEGIEERTFDWRMQELALGSGVPSSVRWIAIDPETLAFIREEPHPDVAERPWARTFLGKLVQRLGTEGAKVVMLDAPLADASSRTRGGMTASDDEALQRALSTASGRPVLGFEASEDAPASVGERLRPFVLFIARHSTRSESRIDLARVLAERRTAFLTPSEGAFEVWAGVEDPADARALGRKLLLREPYNVREFSADRRRDQIRSVDLLVEEAEVHVEGIDPARLMQVRSLEPPVAPLLGARASLGSFALPHVPETRVRAIPHLIAYPSDDGTLRVLPSAPLAAAMELAGTKSLRYAAGALHVGDRFTVPMDSAGFTYLNWEGTGARTVSAWRVLANLIDAESGAPPHYPLDLEHTVVVFSDDVPARVSLRTAVSAGLPRGAVLAQALSNLVTSRAVRRDIPRYDVIATFVLAFAGAFLSLTLRSFLRSGGGVVIYIGVLVGVGFGYALYARSMLVSELRWIAVAGPLLAMLVSSVSTTLYSVRTDLEVSEFITAVLGRYVSPDVARQVFRNVALMRPERRDVTVMISDLEGFGKLSERLSPEQIAELLHEWLTEVTSRVQDRGGHVEYIGDSVMAFWGAPVRHANHAERACACALNVHTALNEAQERWEKRYGERVAFRTGIGTGSALVGDLGSALKSNYTVVGEVVRSAVRLERVNRRFGTSVLVTQATVERCARQFVFREIERVQIAGGRVESIYELLAAQRDFTPGDRTRLTQFEDALAMYRTRRFAEAAKAFDPMGVSDPVSALYAQRSRDFLTHPPPAEWDATSPLAMEGEAA